MLIRATMALRDFYTDDLQLRSFVYLTIRSHRCPHCHDWDGHSGRDSRIASPCRYPGRDLTGTLGVGQDVANLLAKHLLYRTSAFRYAIRESWFGICKAPGPMHTCALQREARSVASLALLCLTKRKWQWSTCLSTCSCSAPSWRVCCWVAKCRSECLERRTKIQKRISGKISTFVWAMKSTSKLQRPAPTLLRLVRECWWDARMGDGKGKVLIATVGQQFADGCKKLPIFPTKAQA